MAQVNVIHISHLPSADPGRQGKTDAVVIYSVDGGPPGTVIEPAETLNETSLKAAIAAQVAQKSDLQGKSFAL